jgi:hypothetical protein
VAVPVGIREATRDHAIIVDALQQGVGGAEIGAINELRAAARVEDKADLGVVGGVVCESDDLSQIVDVARGGVVATDLKEAPGTGDGLEVTAGRQRSA